METQNKYLNKCTVIFFRQDTPIVFKYTCIRKGIRITGCTQILSYNATVGTGSVPTVILYCIFVVYSYSRF